MYAIRSYYELGLADQDDLQQLLPGGFEIGQQANLLEDGRGQILRLVDDQDGAAALGVRLQQVMIERVGQCLDAAAVVNHLDMQFLADRRET